MALSLSILPWGYSPKNCKGFSAFLSHYSYFYKKKMKIKTGLTAVPLREGLVYTAEKLHIDNTHGTSLLQRS